MRWANIQFMLFSVICFLQMFYKIKTLIENEIISLQKERWEVKEKKAKRISKWQTKERKQEVEEERKEKYWEEERCREESQKGPVPVGYSICVLSLGVK